MEELLRMENGDKQPILNVLCRKEQEENISATNKIGVEFIANKKYNSFLVNIISELKSLSYRLLKYIPIECINKNVYKTHGIFDIYAEMKNDDISIHLKIVYQITISIENLRISDVASYNDIIKEINSVRTLLNEEFHRALNMIIDKDYLLVRFKERNLVVDVNNKLIINRKKDLFNVSDRELHEFINNQVDVLINKSELSVDIKKLYLGMINNAKKEQLIYKIQKEINKNFKNRYGIQ